MKIVLLMVAAILFLFSTPVLSEPQVIENDAQPSDGIIELPLKELWRAGGEDDEDVFFGNVLQVLEAPDGGIYVLDSQQLKVFAFTANGELRAALGGRGEGPGEINNVNSIVNMPDGNLGLGQVLPGVIACVMPDGTPAGKIRIKDKEAPDSAFVLFMDGWALGEDILAIVMRWRVSDEGSMAQEMYLRSNDTTGNPLVDFLHKQTLFDLVDFRFTEAGFDFVWTRFGVLADGNVFFAPHRNEYIIHICGPDGALIRKIKRPFESLKRTAEEREESRLSHAAIASHYGREVHGVEVEDTQADIVSLTALDNGNLWVRTSRGDGGRPSGVLTTVDVIDSTGRFVKQLRLLAPGDPARDGIHVLPDGRVVVVKGAVAAYRREQNTERSTDDMVSETELEVICYGQFSGH